MTKDALSPSLQVRTHAMQTFQFFCMCSAHALHNPGPTLPKFYFTIVFFLFFLLISESESDLWEGMFSHTKNLSWYVGA